MEESYQQKFISACNALAETGYDSSNTVEAFNRYNLDRLHAVGAWKKSAPYEIYRDCLKDTASISSSGTSSSRTRGPVKPDVMITAVVESRAHAVWACEVKYLDYRNFQKSDMWAKRHEHGLAQAVWHLYSINALCGGSMALLLINGRFQRLYAITGKDEVQNVLIVEVTHDVASEELLEGFGEYTFGEDAFPNDLASSSATEQDLATHRLFQQLLSALQEAEERVRSGSACRQTVQAHDIPKDNIRLRNCATTMKDVLKRREACQRASGTATDSKGGQDGGGPSAGSSAGADREVGRFLQDWLQVQAAVKAEPTPNSTPDQSIPATTPKLDDDFKSGSMHRGDIVKANANTGVDPSGDNDSGSDSGESDSFVLTMTDITQHMRERGWRFQFISPMQMDRMMEERSTSWRQVPGVDSHVVGRREC
jgi:hypothetical protein